MPPVTDASLTPREQRVLDRFVDLLRHEFGQDLHGVWLYGSRARGEAPGPESDVDLLVVSNRRGPNDGLRLMKLVFEAAEAEGADPVMFAAQLYSPELVEQRRRIRSFFMQEVDRDKIVLFGHREPSLGGVHGDGAGAPHARANRPRRRPPRRFCQRCLLRDALCCAGGPLASRT